MIKRDLATLAMVALAAALGACGGDGNGTSATTTATLLTTTATQPVVTTAGPPRSDPPATRRLAPATTTSVPTSPAQPVLGGPCAFGSSADCIDPDGDGRGTYLSGGAACMQQFATSPELCSDLDGDGAAGFPDSG